MNSDFVNSPNGQIIAGAHKYLSAARLLRESEVFDQRPSLLLTPILQLVAHGVELLLKFAPLQSGLALEDVRKQFGHDLRALWYDDANEEVRRLVGDAAEEFWALASSNGGWPDDFSEDPRVEIIDHLLELAPLHSRDTDFALRYVVAPNTRAPRPAFMIDAFGAVAERVVKNPSLVSP